jgi:hypothetical protein
MTRTLSRRGFLQTCLVTAGGTGAYLLLFDTASHGDTKDLANTLGAKFRHLASVKLIGHEYLRLAPEENDLDRLGELLGPSFSWKSLRQSIKDDYRHGRLVNLQGWPISISAARVYAVVALAHPVPESIE